MSPYIEGNKMNGDVNNQKPVSIPHAMQPNQAGIPSGPGVVNVPVAGIGDDSNEPGSNVNNMGDPGDSGYSSGKGSK